MTKKAIKPEDDIEYLARSRKEAGLTDNKSKQTKKRKSKVKEIGKTQPGEIPNGGWRDGDQAWMHGIGIGD